MPLYDYKCTKCEKRIPDNLQTISDDHFTEASQVGGCDCEDKNGPIKRLMGGAGGTKSLTTDLRSRGYQVNQGSGGRRY